MGSNEKAIRLAIDAGISAEDIAEDLADDGVLNNSHITGILAVKENTSALDKATEMVNKTQKLITALIPIMLLLATAGMELSGLINITPAGEGDEWVWEDEDIGPYEATWGCMDYDALNYDDMATDDDASCEYGHPDHQGYTCDGYHPDETHDEWANHDDPEPEPEPEPCNGNASFYSTEYEWENNSDTITVIWDADWSCEELRDIEVDVFFKDSAGQETFSNTYQQTINYTDGQKYSINISGANQSETYQLELNIWIERSDGWYKEDNKIITDVVQSD